MESLCSKAEHFEKKKNGFPSSGSPGNGAKNKSSDSTQEAKGSSPPLGWPIRKAALSKCRNSDEKENMLLPYLGQSAWETQLEEGVVRVGAEPS
ncbi:hypothetical protein Fmac_020055 [Flemingia macrophylla]|uniref:Uncharacterized protein n=1 Tax=Flemingia macrophylla TaxID=520843 RepID=A0ABD1M9M1_9FABA